MAQEGHQNACNTIYSSVENRQEERYQQPTVQKATKQEFIENKIHPKRACLNFPAQMVRKIGECWKTKIRIALEKFDAGREEYGSNGSYKFGVVIALPMVIHPVTEQQKLLILSSCISMTNLNKRKSLPNALTTGNGVRLSTPAYLTCVHRYCPDLNF